MEKKYEYEAGTVAAAIGLAARLTSALRTMGAFESGRTGWERAIAATHLPIELPVEALHDRLADDAEYEEDELRGPTRDQIVRLLTFWRRRPYRKRSTLAHGPMAHPPSNERQRQRKCDPNCGDENMGVGTRDPSVGPVVGPHGTDDALLHAQGRQLPLAG
ncbi:MAG: hypothetical protein ACYCSF_09765 [Acidimicrobiales bacterium]